MGRRQDLIDTALRLFYEHGIHAIGINQVLQEAGVAKQTLYNHFESKDSLVEAAVEHRDKLFFQWLESRMNSQPATCGEYSDPDHPVHKRCAAHKTKVFELLKRHALEICTSETEADELANALFLLKEGAIVKAHVEGDLDAALKAKAIASRMISPH